MQAVNGRSNHMFSFEFSKMKPARTAEEAVRRHFGDLYAGELKEIQKERLSERLRSWFFDKALDEFLDGFPSPEEADAFKENLESDDRRASFFAEALFRFLGKEAKIYEFAADCEDYHNACCCFAFEIPFNNDWVSEECTGRFFALELGVND